MSGPYDNGSVPLYPTFPACGVDGSVAWPGEGNFNPREAGSFFLCVSVVSSLSSIHC